MRRPAPVSSLVVRALVRILVVGALLASAYAGSGCSAKAPTASTPRPTVAVTTRADDPALRILRRWDSARAAAYAAGSARKLRLLYTASSRAVGPDVRLLRRYAERGLTVHHMRRQLLVVRTSVSRRHLLVLVVTDRLASASARGPRGVIDLPTSRVVTRQLTLRRTRGTWQMASVRALRG